MQKILLVVSIATANLLFVTSCTKDNSNNGTGGGGTGGGGVTTGQVIFWTATDLGCGNITVTCNGSSKIITGYNGSTPACGASYAATFTLAPGTYNFTASCSGVNWTGTVLITAGGCSTMQLTGGGGGGGGTQTEVTICSQTWMVKNLDVSTYRNGNPIPQVTDPVAWAALTTGAWCYYNNDPATGAIYGKLYNWYAVNDPRGLAPAGWHIPTDPEWTTLSNCLGGDFVAGGKMKETGNTHWQGLNTGATNSSGFTGLPGGSRDATGTFFFYLGDYGYWWSATASSTNPPLAWSRSLYSLSAAIYRDNYGKKFGFSVRCVKD